MSEWRPHACVIDGDRWCGMVHRSAVTAARCSIAMGRPRKVYPVLKGGRLEGAPEGTPSVPVWALPRHLRGSP